MTVRIEILKRDKASNSGSALFKAVKKDNLSNLDLLVRESIQNSLDAAKDKKKNNHVSVDFKIGSFDSKTLNSNFELIGENLSEKFTTENARYISIRDWETTGLTGSINEDDGGNLQNLIYRIFREKTDTDSGGFWGLGKTVYYRIGIGLVIFYTKIQEDGGTKQRLAAAFVEDERIGSIIPETIENRGIAFFGETEDDCEEEYRHNSIPITNDSEIEKFLRIFNLSPYPENKTGTTIIIPYIDENDLVSDFSPKIDSEDQSKPMWISSIEDCINIAIQRWYAPRMSNPDYNGAFLIASINGEKINAMDGISGGKYQMQKSFRLLRHMYNACDSGNGSSEFEGMSIKCERIGSTDLSGEKNGGALAWVTVPHRSLGLAASYFKNLYSLVGKYSAQTNDPIIAFCRKPGMIVNYSTESGAWAENTQNIPEGHVLLGIFKLKSDSRFSDPASKYKTTEEYVRSCEGAAHNSWEDENGMQFITKIRRNVKNRLSKNLTPVQRSEYDGKSLLSGILTEMFMPTYVPPSILTGSSQSGNCRTRAASRSKEGRDSPKSKFSTGTSLLKEEYLKMGFSIKMKKGSPVKLYSGIQTETDSLDSLKWEKADSVGTPFPVSLPRLELHSIKIGKEELLGDVAVINNDGIHKTEGITTKQLISEKQTLYGCLIEAKCDCTIEGYACFSSSEKRILVTLECEVVTL